MARLLLVSGKVSVGFNAEPSLGLYQLAAWVKGRGVEVDLLDRELDAPDQWLTRAAEGAYDIIGFSVSHPHMLEELDLLWRFRAAAEQGANPTVFIAGGQEAALNWRQWLDVGIEVCFLGFAEKTLTEFCRRRDAGAATVADLCRGLDGVAWRDDGGAEVFSPAPALTAAEFSGLFHDHFRQVVIPYDRYWAMVRRRMADIELGAARYVIENLRLYTSSHCPRRCGFCSSQAFLPQSQDGPLPIIALTAPQVVDLVRHAVDTYGARGVLFSDDDFPIGNKFGIDRLTEFCRTIIDLKGKGELPGDLQFGCQARALDFVLRGDGNRRPNRDLLQLMRQAGFVSIGIGVETFCDRLLGMPSVNKVGVSVADCRMVIDAILDAGIAAKVQLIVGIPESTVDELTETIVTALHYVRRGCDISINGQMLAMPGAPVFDQGLYEQAALSWTHPRTGRAEAIADYFIPSDPLIARVANRYVDAADAELAELCRRMGWEGKWVHKRVVTLTGLMAVARLVERPDLLALCEAALDDVVAKRTGVRTGPGSLQGED
ncbi:MAG: B12-binding domain-containing radical SAM protein [Actinomycetota bacterium]